MHDLVLKSLHQMILLSSSIMKAFIVLLLGLASIHASHAENKTENGIEDESEESFEEYLDETAFKLIGGTPTTIANVPYIVSIRSSNGRHFCGGTLISNIYVLTAAHCVTGMSASRLSVKSGSTDSKTGGIDTRVRKITIHPRYTGIRNYDSDIAILLLANPVQNAKPIHLASREPSQGQMALVSGWGKTSRYSLSGSRQLQSINVPITNKFECAIAYRYSSPVTKNMICAGLPTGGKDACQGDSGGPLVVGIEVAGIVSWGQGCGSARFPGVYTNVFNFRPWIREITGL